MTNKKLLLFIIFTSAFYGFAQKKAVKSSGREKSIVCANETVQYEDIKTRRLNGIIDSPLDSVIIEIYKISKGETKEPSFTLTEGQIPFKTINISRKRFYLRAITDGNYVLKFGTKEGNWKCSWINVNISKHNRNRLIEVELLPGT